ncbi:hypothetical protein HZH68_006201 [Vespula germanica]|uniref:Ig-like domain-containing protein n=1 Tax=Vespula germanica TaxID=30212 RepID=A0A834KCG0_VESGE|nr:hypothetical protein HZH68_006201 [Vespula germanica]
MAEDRNTGPSFSSSTSWSNLGVVVLGQQGPEFVLEPPSTLVFSNTTGSQLSCSAHGSPTPHVTWITSPDQRSVSAVPGLRQLLGNGTLYFPPFLAQDFRAEVHNARYRCRATSSVGTILSREVTLRAGKPSPRFICFYKNYSISENR